MPTIEAIHEDEWRPDEQAGLSTVDPGEELTWSRYDHTLCQPDTGRGVLATVTDASAKPVASRLGAVAKALGVTMVGVGALVALLLWTGWAGPEASRSTSSWIESTSVAAASAVRTSRETESSDPAATPAPVEPASTVADRAPLEVRVAEAVERGDIARYQGIIYATLGEREFEVASEACATLSAADETGWRLAKLSELHTLVSTKQLPRESYWSSTESGEFGTRALAWHGRYMRASPIAKGWSGAGTVCVLD